MELKEWNVQMTIIGVYDLERAQTYISEKVEGTTTKKYGYCLRVHNVYITTAKASITGNLVCDAHIVADTFIPKEGQILNVSVIDAAEKSGIFCTYQNCIKVLVPPASLDGFSNGAFKLRGKPIKSGDMLPVYVVKIRFQNNGYAAIAKIYSV